MKRVGLGFGQFDFGRGNPPGDIVARGDRETVSLPRRELGLADGDAVYQALIDAISDLEDQAAMRVMAKMVLLLANHVGDETIIREAIAAATAD